MNQFILYSLQCSLSLVLPQVSSLQLVIDSNAALTLNCSSTGSPARNVIWRKDNIVLTNDSSYTTSQILRYGISATYDHFLDVHAAPVELVGVYSCVVHDSLGRNSQTSTIEVYGNFIANA